MQGAWLALVYLALEDACFARFIFSDSHSAWKGIVSSLNDFDKRMLRSFVKLSLFKSLNLQWWMIEGFCLL